MPNNKPKKKAPGEARRYVKGEPPNRTYTAKRRTRVQRMRNEKNATALNKNIKKMQRKRPY